MSLSVNIPRNAGMAFLPSLIEDRRTESGWTIRSPLAKLGVPGIMLVPVAPWQAAQRME